MKKRDASLKIGGELSGANCPGGELSGYPGIEGKQSLCGISLLLLSFFTFKHSQFLSLTSSMNGYPFGRHCYSKLTKHFGITCD